MLFADVVTRYNSSGVQTASGSDISTVQVTAGAASGDVIKISGTATHNSMNSSCVNTFTLQSATAGTQYTVNAGSNVRLYTLANAGTYNITVRDLKYLGQKSTTYEGLFVRTANSSTNLTLNLDNVVFDGFIAPNFNGGGVITNYLGTIAINTFNGVTFSNNLGISGGVIYATNALTINGDVTFSDNSATNFGGAIRSTKAIEMSGSTIEFKNNTAKNKDGGAIHTDGPVTITGTTVDSKTTFSGNQAPKIGGAISCNALTLTTGSFYFTNNKLNVYDSTYHNGGAIKCSSISIDGKEIEFSSNYSTGVGGAIYSASTVTLKGDSITFRENTANTAFGGAIYAKGTVSISGKEVTFSDNKALTTNGYGGAIYCNVGINFSGTDAVVKFSGNTASNEGNDIYINNGNVTLSFQDNGTYSFDGGIYIKDSTSKMTIDQANVTLSGRANDTTNNYQLQSVSVTNSGNLTINLDEIESITGSFNLASKTENLVLNVNSGSKSFNNTITGSGTINKTGNGDLKILLQSTGQISADNLVVSSGRIDIKSATLDSDGYVALESNIDVLKDATFSPGNSIGILKLATGKDLTIEKGGKLLVEIKADDMDKIDGTINYKEGSILELITIDGFTPSLGDDITETLFTNIPGIETALKNKTTTLSSYYYQMNTNPDGSISIGVNPNAVPEPSTWALLILGFTGLMWLKRKHERR